MFYLSDRSLKRLEGIHMLLLQVPKRAIEITPIDFGIPRDGGLRTAERQHELFKQGVSNADGYNDESYHQWGLAFDVFAYVDGKASWEIGHLSVVAGAILQAAAELRVPLQWGGLWGGGPYDEERFTDMPHFQLPRNFR